MQFRLRDFREDALPTALSGRVALPDFAQANVNVETIGEVQVDLQASMKADVCHVHGELLASVTYRCSRCLTEVPARLSSDLAESFTERPNRADDDVHLVTTEWVVLDGYVAESMQLALEYQPLCKTDCQGLCPECGRDLNIGACGCQRDEVDPRFEALRDLLSTGDSE